MITISLIIVPGPGKQRVQIKAGTTAEELSTQFNLTGRQVLMNGQQVPSSTVILADAEVWLVGAVKAHPAPYYPPQPSPPALPAISCPGCGATKLAPNGIQCWYCDRQVLTRPVRLQRTDVYAMDTRGPIALQRRIINE